MTSCVARRVRDVFLSEPGTTTSGCSGALVGFDGVDGGSVPGDPAGALEVVSLLHGQLSPVFQDSVVLVKRLPSKSSPTDQAPSKQIKLVCSPFFLSLVYSFFPGCPC